MTDVELAAVVACFDVDLRKLRSCCVDVDLADNILVPQHQDSIVTICMLPQCLFALANCRK